MFYIYMRPKNEIWKNIIIDGKKTNYKISNLGQVKNKFTGQILRYNINHNGYGRVKINEKYYFVHRLVMDAFTERFDDKNQVDHIDGNKLNNRLDNLEWVNQSENMRRAIDLGLKKPLIGESNPANKYTENQIITACELLKSGKYTRKETAKITGISYKVIRDLVNKKTWIHISSNYNFDNIP